jgi:hypothetical protein
MIKLPVLRSVLKPITVTACWCVAFWTTDKAGHQHALCWPCCRTAQHVLTPQHASDPESVPSHMRGHSCYCLGQILLPHHCQRNLC